MPFRIGSAIFTAVMPLAVPANAQDYPDRPVELIVPWASGGGWDALMRSVNLICSPIVGVLIGALHGAGSSIANLVACAIRNHLK